MAVLHVKQACLLQCISPPPVTAGVLANTSILAAKSLPTSCQSHYPQYAWNRARFHPIPSRAPGITTFPYVSRTLPECDPGPIFRYLAVPSKGDGSWPCPKLTTISFGDSSHDFSLEHIVAFVSRCVSAEAGDGVRLPMRLSKVSAPLRFVYALAKEKGGKGVVFKHL